MRQWMLKITAYADRLLDDLDGLDWPERVKRMHARVNGTRPDRHNWLTPVNVKVAEPVGV